MQSFYTCRRIISTIALASIQQLFNDQGMALGKRIRYYREKAGMTLEQLSSRSGVDIGTISALENRDSSRSKYATAISAALGMSVESLENESADASNIAPAPLGARPIPLINHVQAGNWGEIVDSYAPGAGSEYLLTDLELSPHAFALEIKGDSMLPDFKPGDRVIIDPEIAPQPGDFVVAKNGSEEATFKKYRPRSIDEHGEVVFELVPLNDDYPTLRSDTCHIAIVGVMVEYRKYRRK